MDVLPRWLLSLVMGRFRFLHRLTHGATAGQAIRQGEHTDYLGDHIGAHVPFGGQRSIW